MSLWWLVYKQDDRVLGIVIVEAAALISARMTVTLAGLNTEATFAEGHELDAKSAARIPKRNIGRMISPKDARRLLDRIARK